MVLCAGILTLPLSERELLGLLNGVALRSREAIPHLLRRFRWCQPKDVSRSRQLLCLLHMHSCTILVYRPFSGST